MDIAIGLIPAAASYQLRQAVLRPHQRIDEVGDKVDDEPGTATFGATDRARGALVAVGTVFREAAPFDPAQAGGPAATWRLRWMATRHDVQGQGIGSMVLNAALDHVAAESGGLLWCNARVGAIGFYERAGFSAWGDVWVIPGIGPHVVMWRRIETGTTT
jgi:GNAT superfamily N-acetyltransferase